MKDAKNKIREELDRRIEELTGQNIYIPNSIHTVDFLIASARKKVQES
jgi:hypothetical protein